MSDTPTRTPIRAKSSSYDPADSPRMQLVRRWSALSSRRSSRSQLQTPEDLDEPTLIFTAKFANLDLSTDNRARLALLRDTIGTPTLTLSEVVAGTDSGATDYRYTAKFDREVAATIAERWLGEVITNLAHSQGVHEVSSAMLHDKGSRDVDPERSTFWSVLVKKQLVAACSPIESVVHIADPSIEPAQDAFLEPGEDAPVAQSILQDDETMKNVRSQVTSCKAARFVLRVTPAGRAEPVSPRGGKEAQRAMLSELELFG